ncbi:trypsin-like serine peptidase [Pseudonocardia endophytica]|uniref:Trypsin-like peptidase n=1 Tax=Pseudonocardia endophytica TaxID=401976 RepID=A0A4R1HW14_PSEEN|nr:trypsin-like serine protease [Pseudonocardia endophytica]TCK24930.1 trypsin-like peptidase [Pseudonocardia endophytica]
MGPSPRRVPRRVVTVALVILAVTAMATTSVGIRADRARATAVPAAPVSPSAPAAPADAQTAAARYPAVGALFSGTADDPGDHFCTASVVSSPARNMLMTAAHCVSDGDGSPPRTGIVFAPGYQAGDAPHGYWTVTSAVVDTAWLDDGDPDDDVAFLTVDRAGSPPIQQVTGAYGVDFDGDGAPVGVIAVGYNLDDEEATTVSGTAVPWSPTQWQVAAPGLSDGTSGGPLLSGPGDTEIVGVIGGYEQGGDTSDVSYAAALGSSLQSLHDQVGGTD